LAAKILDGKEVAAVVRADVKRRVDALRESRGVQPGLAAILVGEDPASIVYVRNKRRACEKVGIRSWLFELPSATPEENLLNVIDELNAEPEVHGILVQLPLPDHIDTRHVIERIAPKKDVDGFHPENYGLLASGRPRFVPCTPLGIQRILEHYEIPTSGKHVVIVGRSNLVGKPLGLLLLQRGKYADATVTICHSRTANLGAITRTADILVAAVGRPKLVTRDMVQPGSVVIDVGINRVDGQLVGDVDFPSVSEIAAAITPVPGGVGPMTVAMLLHNTVVAAERSVAKGE